MNLIEKSIEIILINQHLGGAFIASPNFSEYQYGWFRDGAYISYALDLYGYHSNAERFFDWCAQVIERYSEKIIKVTEEPDLVLGDNRTNTFHCRFTPDGGEMISGWSTHQLDGLGVLLWAMVEHCQFLQLRSIPKKWQPAIDLIINYCLALWRFPCADCWEENDEQLHTYTLASLVGGFQAYQEFSGADKLKYEIDLITKFVDDHCVSPLGYYKKSADQEIVDANLLGLVFPFKVVLGENPKFLATLTRIESELYRSGGGVLRYSGDTYFGGGEWIILTAWLGSTYIALGAVDKAIEIKTWIEQQADPNGFLPEQIVDHVQDKSQLQNWVDKWGPPAVPLLWSHANYLILSKQIEEMR